MSTDHQTSWGRIRRQESPQNFDSHVDATLIILKSFWNYPLCSVNFSFLLKKKSCPILFIFLSCRHDAPCHNCAVYIVNNNNSSFGNCTVTSSLNQALRLPGYSDHSAPRRPGEGESIRHGWNRTSFFKRRNCFVKHKQVTLNETHDTSQRPKSVLLLCSASAMSLLSCATGLSTSFNHCLILFYTK